MKGWWRPLASRDDIDLSIAIAALPYDMLGELARGLGPDNQTHPPYADDLLRASADRIRQALVDRWARLPVRARYSAAEHAARRAGSAPHQRGAHAAA